MKKLKFKFWIKNYIIKNRQMLDRVLKRFLKVLIWKLHFFLSLNFYLFIIIFNTENSPWQLPVRNDQKVQNYIQVSNLTVWDVESWIVVVVVSYQMDPFPFGMLTIPQLCFRIFKEILGVDWLRCWFRK